MSRAKFRPKRPAADPVEPAGTVNLSELFPDAFSVASRVGVVVGTTPLLVPGSGTRSAAESKPLHRTTPDAAQRAWKSEPDPGDGFGAGLGAGAAAAITCTLSVCSVVAWPSLALRIHWYVLPAVPGA